MSFFKNVFENVTHLPALIRLRISVANPGSCAFFTPGSGMGKNQDQDPGHIYESLEFLGLKILKFLDADPG
jgi:hypothetical protein